VQLPVFASPESIFRDYAYFSSFSTSWLEHVHLHVARSIERQELNSQSFVVEVASNDGYLLKSFVAAGVRVLGVEPAENVAEAARAAAVPTTSTFFGACTADEIAAEHGKADMMLANNVLAHVPDLHDFIEGFRRLLASEGIATFEFPHLVPLIEQTQFDTIYHEHFSYLSLLAVEPIFSAHGLRIVDIERLTTHGGSLRLWVVHEGSSHEISPSVAALHAIEKAAGLDRIDTYHAFEERVRTIKRRLLKFLIGARERGESVVGYGAAAKGNTLLNYCGVRGDLLDFVVDRSPHKQGTLLPGSRLAVRPVEALIEAAPDFVLILPWNLKAEIIEQMAIVRSWSGRFVTAIPEITVT
jgi:SAM-dependent methyltransferase